MHLRRAIIRHVLITLSFVLLYLLLNRPEIVFFSRIGFVAWYPAIGLAMALMLGVSPWYAISGLFFRCSGWQDYVCSSPSCRSAARLTRQELLFVTVRRLTFCEVHCKSILGLRRRQRCGPLSLY